MSHTPLTHSWLFLMGSTFQHTLKFCSYLKPSFENNMKRVTPPIYPQYTPLQLSRKLFYSEFSLYFHSLCIDVSDHFFWREYRVNRTRVHSLSSEFSLSCMELESNENHYSASDISALHRWSEFTQLYFYREWDVQPKYENLLSFSFLEPHNILP